MFARNEVNENPDCRSGFPGSRRWREQGYITAGPRVDECDQAGSNSRQVSGSCDHQIKSSGTLNCA